MTPLRQRMLEDMSIRNFAEKTQQSYLEHVSRYARYFHRSPEDLGPEEVRAYQLYLTETRKLAPSTISIATSALRFLYRVTLKRDWEPADIPLVGLTAWQVLIETAKLKKGQKVLIHAGSGGVGTFAIQLAKHAGAIVATTTSTSNVDFVKRLGADIVIDYKKRDRFEDLLRDYDVVLNSLDGDTLKKSLQVLKPGGRLISISGAPDPAFAKHLGLN